jgi:hypothetical protein
VPEIVDLAKSTKTRFIEHGAGGIDCVLKGEGEAGIAPLLAAIERGDNPITIAGAEATGWSARSARSRICGLFASPASLLSAMSPSCRRSTGWRIARAGIKKQYYLETRGDVLLRNKEVFRFWNKLGLEYMFLGIEAIDEEGLQKLGTESWLSDGGRVTSRDYRLYDI